MHGPLVRAGLGTRGYGWVGESVAVVMHGVSGAGPSPLVYYSVRQRQCLVEGFMHSCSRGDGRGNRFCSRRRP